MLHTFGDKRHYQTSCLLIDDHLAKRFSPVKVYVFINHRSLQRKSCLYLSIVPDVVSERHEAGLELLGLKTARPVLVEVEERLPELVHLLVRDALRVSRQNLQNQNGNQC